VKLDSKPQIRKPKAVIFDIGRVIVRLQPEAAFAPLATSISNRSAETVWTLIQRDARWNDWQEGRMNPREWHRHLTQQLEISLEFEQFCACWNMALHPETILSERLFGMLAEHCKLAVLSNTDPIHSEWMEAKFPFLTHFPVRIYSWRVGASKPSAKIYRVALNSLGVEAGEAFYVDDIPEFVEAAHGIGIDACIFKNPKDFADELRLRGLPYS